MQFETIDPTPASVRLINSWLETVVKGRMVNAWRITSAWKPYKGSIEVAIDFEHQGSKRMDFELADSGLTYDMIDNIVQHAYNDYLEAAA